MGLGETFLLSMGYGWRTLTLSQAVKNSFPQSQFQKYKHDKNSNRVSNSPPTLPVGTFQQTWMQKNPNMGEKDETFFLKQQESPEKSVKHTVLVWGGDAPPQENMSRPDVTE